VEEEEKGENAGVAAAVEAGLVETEVSKPVHYNKEFGLWLEGDNYLQLSQHNFKGNPDKVHILDPVSYQSAANAGSYLGNKRTSFFSQIEN
jgi:hypothetical protein